MALNLELSDQKEKDDISEIDVPANDVVINDELVKIRKRITRKVDFRLIPILAAMYAISGIDRVNLSVARIAGMDKELGLNIGNRYSIALLVFFIPYFFFDIPSNVMLRKFGTARWLSFLSFAWGISILGSGFCHSWEVIVGVRVLVGTFEAGFVPGCFYLMSCWYERYQIHKRMAWFYSVSLIAGGFGNILAYGLAQMDGIAGYRGWRWIFIFEGLIPILLAGLGYWLIIDFPDKLHLARRPFLDPGEIQVVKDRLQADRGDQNFDKFTFKKVVHIMMQWEIWVYALMFMGAGVGVYSLAYFTPQIIQGMGFKSINDVYLLSAPPNIAAVPYSIGLSMLADRYKLRTPFIIFNSLLTIIGLMLTAYDRVQGVRYFGVFLGVAGANANLPTMLAWQANNIRGQSTRAVASGIQLAAGAIGGVYASTTFMQKEAPYYRSGLWATAAMQFTIIVVAVGLAAYYYRENRNADRLGTVIKGMEGFRYTI